MPTIDLSLPGSVPLFLAVVFLEALSVGVLMLFLWMFRLQNDKYRRLFSVLGAEDAWGTPGRILLPLYVVLTLTTMGFTLWLFLWQPHFL